MSGRRAAAVAASVGAALLLGCGGDTDAPPVPSACTDGRETILRALQGAPAAATLPDGAPLSACVRNARTDAELQNVGSVLSGAAEDLEERAPAEPRAALELGFLIGAARRGAGSSSGIQDELVRRLERSAALEGTGTPVVAALNEGLAAGEARG